MMDPDRQRRQLLSLVTSLQAEQFYGTAQIEFLGGNITLVRLSQTLKLETIDAHSEVSSTQA